MLFVLLVFGAFQLFQNIPELLRHRKSNQSRILQNADSLVGQIEENDRSADGTAVSDDLLVDDT